MVGLADGEISLRIYLTVWTEYRRVTDRRTDRNLVYASRGKKLYKSVFIRLSYCKNKNGAVAFTARRVCIARTMS